MRLGGILFAAVHAAKRQHMAIIKHKSQRVGIFIDTQNLYHSAKNLYKAKVNFGQVVKEAVAGRQLIRAVAYVIRTESEEEKGFFDALNKLGIETKVKDIRVFAGGAKKADWDLGTGIDAVAMAKSSTLLYSPPATATLCRLSSTLSTPRLPGRGDCLWQVILGPAARGGRRLYRHVRRPAQLPHRLPRRRGFFLWRTLFGTISGDNPDHDNGATEEKHDEPCPRLIAQPHQHFHSRPVSGWHE
jgi:hypothetical protein